MLVVDPELRATIDECLEHPWITQKMPSLTDSTDGLTGAMGSLDFSKRKVARERTLLSTLNDVMVDRVIKDPKKESAVKVWDKNHAATPPSNASGNKAKESPKKGKGKKSAGNEEVPAANRNVKEFMEMGGKGDQALFGYDGESRYNVTDDKGALSGGV